MRRTITNNPTAQDGTQAAGTAPGGDRVRSLSIGISLPSSSGGSGPSTVIPYQSPFVDVPAYKPEPTVPPFDRRNASGTFAVVWLLANGVLFSDHCRDLGQALRVARMHKRSPTWIIRGLERELDVAQLCLSYQSSDWLNSKQFDQAIRQVINVVATTNLVEPSRFVQPVRPDRDDQPR